MNKLNSERIEQALQLLGERLALADVGPYGLVVCGGAALISCGLVSMLRQMGFKDVAERI